MVYNIIIKRNRTVSPEKEDKEMLEIREEELNIVSGGGIIKEMLGTSGGYAYAPGDKVTDYWNPENGVGTVTKNVGVCGNFYIDEVNFPDVNQTYNQYESNLRPA